MRKQRLQVLVLFGVPCLLLISVLVFAVVVSGTPKLDVVAAECDDEAAPEILTVGDEGSTLAVQSTGTPETTDKVARCVLDELGVPDRIVAKMDDTAQERQTETWDGLEISWTHRPADGLQLVIAEG